MNVAYSVSEILKCVEIINQPKNYYKNGDKPFNLNDNTSMKILFEGNNDNIDGDKLIMEMMMINIMNTIWVLYRLDFAVLQGKQPKEIQKLLSNDPDWSANAVTAVFTGEDGFETDNLSDLANSRFSTTQDARRRTIADDQIEYIESKLRSKYIDISIICILHLKYLMNILPLFK